MSSLGSSRDVGASKLALPHLIRCETDPHIRPSSPSELQPNVLIISGFPWHCSEEDVHRYLRLVYPDVAPVTTRLYTHPHNGASRGICFVEYPHTLPPDSARRPHNVALYHRQPPFSLATGLAMVRQDKGGDPSAPHSSPSLPLVDLTLVQHQVTANPYEQRLELRAERYHLTLADTQWDRDGPLPPLPFDPPNRRQQVAFGDEGREVRCGAHLEVPNTCGSSEALLRVERCRKRLRTAMERERAAQGSENAA